MMLLYYFVFNTLNDHEFQQVSINSDRNAVTHSRVRIWNLTNKYARQQHQGHQPNLHHSHREYHVLRKSPEQIRTRANRALKSTLLNDKHHTNTTAGVLCVVNRTSQPLDSKSACCYFGWHGFASCVAVDALHSGVVWLRAPILRDTVRKYGIAQNTHRPNEAKRRDVKLGLAVGRNYSTYVRALYGLAYGYRPQVRWSCCVWRFHELPLRLFCVWRYSSAAVFGRMMNVRSVLGVWFFVRVVVFATVFRFNPLVGSAPEKE